MTMTKLLNMREINTLYKKGELKYGICFNWKSNGYFYIRTRYIEAQVPYGKEQKFMNAYPGADYDNMKITSDKQSFQFRIILNYNGQCPQELEEALTSGGGAFYKNCISRGKFIERIINEYGFEFFNAPNPSVIRNIVQRRHPDYLIDFDEGYNIPLSGRC